MNQLLQFTESVNEVKLVGHIGGEISDEKATIFSLVTNTDIKWVLFKAQIIRFSLRAKTINFLKK